MTRKTLKTRSTYFTVIKPRTEGTGFFDDACKEFYLCRLLHCQHAFQIKLHAYLLLDQQIFLLFTPQTPSSFHSFLSYLNRVYNDYYLVRFERKVKVWRGAPLISLLPSDKLVLDCQKFLERFTLKAENNNHPGEYLYSSYCSNAFSVIPKPLIRHKAFIQFLRKEVGSLGSYRDFIATPFRVQYEYFLQSRLLEGRPLLRLRYANQARERQYFDRYREKRHNIRNITPL